MSLALKTKNSSNVYKCRVEWVCIIFVLKRNTQTDLKESENSIFLGVRNQTDIILLFYVFLLFLLSNFAKDFSWHFGCLLSPSLEQPPSAGDFNIPRVTFTKKGPSYPSLIEIILKSILHPPLDLENPSRFSF